MPKRKGTNTGEPRQMGRIEQFCDSFNCDILWRAVDKPRAIAARVRYAEEMAERPDMTVAQALIAARYAAGELATPSMIQGSVEFGMLASLARTRAQAGDNPAAVADLIETHLPSLPPDDADFAARWVTNLRSSPDDWQGVPRMAS
jgi:hypothetical protein